MTDTPIDSSVAHTARVWNYWLGGKDNYPVDREIGDRVKALFPQVVDVATGDRLFLRRSVTYAIQQEGIDQFLDVGTGLPTANNTHEVAQTLNPEARVVYVDNDPLVLAHARALLTGTEQGRTQFVGEDLREVDAVLDAARETLDFDRPILLTLMGTMGHFEHDQALELVRAYVDALPAGSLVAICDGVFGDDGGAAPDANALEGMKLWQEQVAQPYIMRSVPEFGSYFEDLELIDPGVVSVFHWRPEPTEVGSLRDVPQYAGLAKKA
ncbi:SAM-dependent methyltransferase [Nocardiopsis sp. MG754419]|uniref:SAM-dependent methyltransferase n=1 Tax=Nocardiopsis sp. MG754419 TaxID=2259865 RepID=UPI001BAE4DE6|nr:SAM-dependent methyltransferase [Nocardiopsis sp. MG754419]MBR8743973.1 SAM-dependent methyltransferase [Nocardiopsis sp. MG754419]